MISQCWYCSGRVHKSRAVYEGERGRDCDLGAHLWGQGQGHLTMACGCVMGRSWTWAESTCFRSPRRVIDISGSECMQISDTVRGLTLHPLKWGLTSFLSCGSSWANTDLRRKILHSVRAWIVRPCLDLNLRAQERGVALTPINDPTKVSN